MDVNLFEVLVDRDIINDRTEFEATQSRRDLSGVSYLKFSGRFVYVTHSVSDNGAGTVIGECVETGKSVTFSTGDIRTIDGMDPRRLAGIYALDGEGNSVRQGNRRGRKPKNKTAA